MSRSQLARLLDLPDDALQQVLDYAGTLSPDAAADHFRNLLGESPAALDFVAAFNRGRQAATAAAPAAAAMSRDSSNNYGSGSGSGSATPHDGVPKARRKKKVVAPLHTPAPRAVTSTAPPPGAVYHKKGAVEEYMGGSKQPAGKPASTSTSTPPPAQNQKLPKQSGSLVQDALAPKAKPASKAATPTTTKPVKVHITGGTAMHGASTALSDLDAAIRALEITTNPVMAEGKDTRRRRCDCVATRHPLQTAAPNCVRCGKVVCVREGLGPCTACGAALLAPADVQAMIRALRDARGRERMEADKKAHAKKGKVLPGGQKIAGTTRWAGDDGDFVSPAEAQARTEQQEAAAALAQARAHRDRLLRFQAENAQRTTVRDEAADFDVGEALAAEQQGGGTRNLWASPEERAEALRRQQALLRKMEWEAKPEYEKRQQVLSIDVTGRKVFRKTVQVARPATPEEEEAEVEPEKAKQPPQPEGGGTFSHNPLLGRLIRPVYVPKEDNGKEDKGKAKAKAKANEGKAIEKGKGKGKVKDNTSAKADDSKSEDTDANDANDANDATNTDTTTTTTPARRTRWRRVQDDLDDNEAVVLDGGLSVAG